MRTGRQSLLQLFRVITQGGPLISIVSVRIALPEQISNTLSKAVIHHGAAKLPNNTIQGGTISHVGQFYFEPSLLQTVEKLSPYNTNRQVHVQNAVDTIYRQGTANGDNPVITITFLGATLQDGLHGVIDVGVNPKATRRPNPVNFWTANGGVPIQSSPWRGYPWIGRVRRFWQN
jgi:hypothetical protein